MIKSKAAHLAFPVLLLMAGLMSVSVAFAASSEKSKADVTVKGSDPVVVAGNSKLVRNANGISFTVETSMLEPGHAFTVWVKVHEPVGTIVTLFGGSLSDKKGEAKFGGHLSTGPIPDADGVTVKSSGDGNFDTPFTSKVTLVIRDHGPKIPGQVYYQTHSLNGGCLPGEPNDGDGKCTSVQQAVHMPAN